MYGAGGLGSEKKNPTKLLPEGLHKVGTIVRHDPVDFIVNPVLSEHLIKMGRQDIISVGSFHSAAGQAHSLAIKPNEKMGGHAKERPVKDK